MANGAQHRPSCITGRTGEKRTHSTNGRHGPLRLARVDDDRSLHHAVRKRLTAHAPQITLDSYTSAAHAIARLPSAPPAAVLMYVGRSGLRGVECTKQLLSRVPRLHIVMFTCRADKESVLRSLLAGARGYLLKPASTDHLILAASGAPVLCPEAQKAVLDLFQALGRGPSPGGLSTRECEVMLRASEGMTDKEIAAALGLTTGTVHAHMASVYERLRVHDRRTAARRFLRLCRGGISEELGV